MRRALAWAVLGCLALFVLAWYAALWFFAPVGAAVITSCAVIAAAVPWALGEVFG